MSENANQELELLKEIETNLRKQHQVLLMHQVKDDCGCNKGKPKWQYRCAEAFKINGALTQLETLRKQQSKA